MRLFIRLVFFAALMGIIAVNSNADPLKKLSQKLEKGLAGQQNKKVAVLSFPYSDGGISKGSTIVQERFTTYLVENGKVEVIERNLLEKVLEEVKLGDMGFISPDTVKQLGTILGVGAIVTGTLNDLSQSKTEVNARIIQADTGKILAAGQTAFKRTWTDSPIKPSGQTGTVKPPVQPGDRGKKPLVQIALLLDTSNSMDGLIAQAKSQLWKVVNELASSQRDGQNPVVQVALYEYGNNNLSRGENFVKQVLPFSLDLDAVSEKLFYLRTNGGDEYCGAVIRDTVQNLNWDKNDDVYKAMFIAGNEPFTQGPVDFKQAAESAANKGIIVNTIFCGPNNEGIATMWRAGAEAGRGDYMYIDARTDVVVIHAPQDDEIARLGNQLNNTYIPYGSSGKTLYERQSQMDTMAEGASQAGAPVERAMFKAKSQYSQSATWDVVSQVESKQIKTNELKKEYLPTELQKMSQKEIDDFVVKKIEERKSIQSKINELSDARKKYLTEAEKSGQGKQTLDKAILDAVRKQATKKNLKFAP